MVTEIKLFEFPDLGLLDICLGGMDEERSLQKKVGYTRRIARPHFGCSCLHKETWRSTQTNSTVYLHTRYANCAEVYGWIFEHLFRTVKILTFACNKFVI